MSMDKVFKSDEKLFISPPICLKGFLEEAVAIESRFHNFFGFETGSQTQRISFIKFLENRDYSSKQADKIIKNVEYVKIF